MTKNKGSITVTTDLLESMLMLPPGVKVIGIFQDSEAFHRNALKVMLEGEGLPEVAEGALVPEVSLARETRIIF